MVHAIFQLHAFFVCYQGYESMWIAARSLAHPGLRQRHKLCPFNPFAFKRRGVRAIMRHLSAGKLLSLSGLSQESAFSTSASIHVGYNVISFSSGRLTSLERA